MKITSTRIAKDVLKWLEGPKKACPIIPIGGSNGYMIVPNATVELDVHQHLKAKGKCEVCGIGGLAAALAFRIDNLKLDSGDPAECDCVSCIQGVGVTVSRERLEKFLKPYFKPAQLDAIETAFEHGNEMLGKNDYKWSATKRLKVICKNIIANKGKFVLLRYNR
jgi:hypothetical protein